MTKFWLNWLMDAEILDRFCSMVFILALTDMIVCESGLSGTGGGLIWEIKFLLFSWSKTLNLSNILSCEALISLISAACSSRTFFSSASILLICSSTSLE